MTEHGREIGLWVKLDLLLALLVVLVPALYAWHVELAYGACSSGGRRLTFGFVDVAPSEICHLYLWSMIGVCLFAGYRLGRNAIARAITLWG